MEIKLSPDVEAIVNDKVASGDFDSPSAVVEQAVRLMLDQQHVERWDLEALWAEIEKGRQSARDGKFSSVTADDLKAYVRQFAHG